MQEIALIWSNFVLIMSRLNLLRDTACVEEQHYDDERSCIQNSTSLLEALPQELLFCGVDHDDLKQLFLVSKTVRDAAIIAKKSHFAYSTPEFDDLEAPNAPKQARKMNRPRINKKKLHDISVALFADECDED
ncbi:F-box protein SKIP27 [Bienertia sinuspersici]